MIAVKASGVEDMVIDGANGYLTEEVPEIWAEQIVALMSDTEEVRKLAYGAYLIATKYSENQICAKSSRSL